MLPVRSFGVRGYTFGRCGSRPEELVEGMRRLAEALHATLPDWLTEPFVARVIERLLQLRGRWNATRFGASMDLDWI